MEISGSRRPMRPAPTSRGQACVLLVEVLAATTQQVREVFPSAGPSPCPPRVSGDPMEVMIDIAGVLDEGVISAVEQLKTKKAAFDAAAKRLEELDHTQVAKVPGSASLLPTRIADVRAAREEFDRAACDVLDAVSRAIDAAPISAPADVVGGARHEPAAEVSASAGRSSPVELEFVEHEDHTRAEVHLSLQGERWHGWGRSRRNPSDPDVPLIGEELAAARALSDLSRHLEHSAIEAVERLATAAES